MDRIAARGAAAWPQRLRTGRAVRVIAISGAVTVHGLLALALLNHRAPAPPPQDLVTIALFEAAPPPASAPSEPAPSQERQPPDRMPAPETEATEAAEAAPSPVSEPQAETAEPPGPAPSSASSASAAPAPEQDEEAEQDEEDWQRAVPEGFYALPESLRREGNPNVAFGTFCEELGPFAGTISRNCPGGRRYASLNVQRPRDNFSPDAFTDAGYLFGRQYAGRSAREVAAELGFIDPFAEPRDDPDAFANAPIKLPSDRLLGDFPLK